MLESMKLLRIFFFLLGRKTSEQKDPTMTRFLPPNLLSMFIPREPLEYVPPPEKRKLPPLTVCFVIIEVALLTRAGSVTNCTKVRREH